jgi:hypothetical protein
MDPTVTDLEPGIERDHVVCGDEHGEARDDRATVVRYAAEERAPLKAQTRQEAG